jgi:hypothetical protein
MDLNVSWILMWPEVGNQTNARGEHLWFEDFSDRHVHEEIATFAKRLEDKCLQLLRLCPARTRTLDRLVAELVH